MLSDLNKDVETAAKQIAGNWRKFDSFGWSSDAQPENPEQWAIVNLSHRDSGILDKSNEATILDALSEFAGDSRDGATVETQRHGHWAVGHVNALVIRCVDDTGAPTAAFRVLHELAMSLADYSILDEDDHSRRECEAEDEGWSSYGARDFRRALSKLAPHHSDLFDRVPDDHLRTVWSWIADVKNIGGGSGVENQDDGPYFLFDDVFGDRVPAWRALSWEYVRSVFLDVKADQAPMRLARKVDARIRSEKTDNG